MDFAAVGATMRAMNILIRPFPVQETPDDDESMPKTKNSNINVNMQPTMVAMLDKLVKATGCSTRAELVRILVRDEAKRRGLPMNPRKKGK